MSTLRWVVWITIFLFAFLFFTYVALSVTAIYEPLPERKEAFQNVISQIVASGIGTWAFVKPFLQLALILLIVNWILEKWGINSKSSVIGLDWNVQTVIALTVIGAFAIAALCGLSEVGTLKDLALVVVGFYFGTKKESAVFLPSRDAGDAFEMAGDCPFGWFAQVAAVFAADGRIKFSDGAAFSVLSNVSDFSHCSRDFPGDSEVFPRRSRLFPDGFLFFRLNVDFFRAANRFSRLNRNLFRPDFRFFPADAKYSLVNFNFPARFRLCF